MRYEWPYRIKPPIPAFLPRTPRGDARLSRIFTDHDNSIDKYDILQAQGRQRGEAENSLEPGSSGLPAGSLIFFICLIVGRRTKAGRIVTFVSSWTLESGECLGTGEGGGANSARVCRSLTPSDDGEGRRDYPIQDHDKKRDRREVPYHCASQRHPPSTKGKRRVFPALKLNRFGLRGPHGSDYESTDKKQRNNRAA